MIRSFIIGVGVVGLSAGGLFGCSSSSNSSHFGGAGASGGSGGSSGGGSGGTINLGGSGGGGGSKLTGTPDCTHWDDSDFDGDGYTVSQGDCNDCTAQMNPGAYDYPGNGVDEDCDGTPDDEPTGCDKQTVGITYNDPMAAAKAIGLCRVAKGKSWGVVSTKYVKADGTPGMNDVSHGLLPNFGPNVHPRQGSTLLALSSGAARRPGDPGFQTPGGAQCLCGDQTGTQSQTPPGFPIDSPSCNGVQTANDHTAHDPAALELTIKTPSNANQFGFDFDFYTVEYIEYVCTQFNDFFVALVDPPPSNAQNGNISFDSKGNPVSVNNGFLEVCSPGSHNGKSFTCSKGTSELQGTGFGGHAATGWLHTQAPVPAGKTIKVRFAIWDMGDEILDSTVLIDNVTWDVGQGDANTQPVPQ